MHRTKYNKTSYASIQKLLLINEVCKHVWLSMVSRFHIHSFRQAQVKNIWGKNCENFQK